VEVIFEGADRGTPDDTEQEIAFGRSLTLEETMDDDVLIAYSMNGEALPIEHGGPVRLIVPGWYGMASVKWLARIVAAPEPFQGYFQTEDYVLRRGNSSDPLRNASVRAVITGPVESMRVGRGKVQVEGYCWSGGRHVEGVELSDDGGVGWIDCDLGEQISLYAWRSWQCEWTPRATGEVTLIVRARDSEGNIQPLEQVWNERGYANNACQKLAVMVEP
jgi:DMSO/TMAO reductase YedYZ molybdopterin-dependent catalytic subunit